MKKSIRMLSVVPVLALFAVMAMGSGSDTSDKDDGGNKKEIVSTTENETTAATEVSIVEQVLLDQDGLKITAKEYVNDDIWGDGIKLLIENNSDTDLGVGCNALIVNNYMITDLFSSSIAAGKKANETMWLSSHELEAAGIENVGQVEIHFHIFDSNSYETKFDSDVVTIKTSAFEEMDTTPNDAGQELFNQDGIRIVGKVVDEDSFWGTAVLLYVENTSGTNVTISCEDLSVNGFMVTPVFSSTVYDGKMAFDEITILSPELEENDITSVDEIELQFHIFNTDTYNTIIDTEPITFSAK